VTTICDCDGAISGALAPVWGDLAVDGDGLLAGWPSG
jgi:hypothetical protein